MPKSKVLNTADLMRLLRENGDFTQALEHGNHAINNPSLIMQLMLHQTESGMSIPQIADSAMLSQSFAYQIFSGIRNPGRNTLICIACAMRLPLNSVQRLLTLSQKGELYPRVRRDAAIIFALEHGYSLIQMEDLLQKAGEASILAKQA